MGRQVETFSDANRFKGGVAAAPSMFAFANKQSSLFLPLLLPTDAICSLHTPTSTHLPVTAVCCCPLHWVYAECECYTAVRVLSSNTARLLSYLCTAIDN